MKILRRLLALAAALMLCCCGAAADSSPEDVLLTINGKDVTRGEYDRYLANVTSLYAYFGYDVTSPESVIYLERLALGTLIETAMMDVKIAEMGVTLTTAEREAAEQEARSNWVEDVSSAMSIYGATGASTEAERAAALVQALSDLEARGYTEQSYIDDAISNALYVKLEELMAAGATVEDGDVEWYYDELVSNHRQLFAEDAAAYEEAMLGMLYGMSGYENGIWYVPEGYRSVTHILIAVDETLMNDWADLQATYEEQQNTLEAGETLIGEAVTAEEVENARLAALVSVQTTIEEINNRLNAGEAFSDLIPLYTADTTMNDEAEIAEGFPVHMDSILFPIGYRDAAFTLENHGDISEPFVADEGVYILCYAGDVPGGPVPLTGELHAALYAELLRDAKTAQREVTMSQWLDSAKITYSDEALAILGAE